MRKRNPSGALGATGGSSEYLSGLLGCVSAITGCELEWLGFYLPANSFGGVKPLLACSPENVSYLHDNRCVVLCTTLQPRLRSGGFIAVIDPPSASPSAVPSRMPARCRVFFALIAG